MTTRFSRPSLLALAVSLSAFSGGVTLAAEEMDHSAMGHGTMSMDHSQMNHGATKAPMEGMDHSKMDHSKMAGGKMDHGAMADHAPMKIAATSQLGKDGKSVTLLPKRALSAGKYKVVWTAAGADMHKMTGNYSFTVK